MKKVVSIIMAVVFAAVLAACGGSAHKVVSLPDIRGNNHPCSGQHYTMPCALRGQKAPLSVPKAPLGIAVKHGIDYAWSCPSPSGWDFGASYLSPDFSKNWSVGCVSAWQGRGKGTVPVYESSANRAEQGFNAGFNDAFTARDQARSLMHMPDYRSIPYAVDCDCSVGNIVSYFQGADAGTASKLHISRAAAVQEVGTYAGYYQVMGLYRAGVIGHVNWQTYAWSGGNWAPATIAPLEQYLNSNAFDYDRALAVDYGQSNFVVPGPSPHQISGWRNAREVAFSSYHKDKCKYPQQSKKCQGLGQTVITNQNHLWTVYKRWACFGPHSNSRTRGSEVCWIVRPMANYQSGAARASDRAYNIDGCDGPVNFTHPIHTPLCDGLRQKREYFRKHVSALVVKYS